MPIQPEAMAKAAEISELSSVIKREEQLTPDLIRIHERLKALTDTLIGGSPEVAAQKEGTRPSGSGLLTILRQNLDTQEDLIAAIQSQLSTLEELI